MASGNRPAFAMLAIVRRCLGAALVLVVAFGTARAADGLTGVALVVGQSGYASLPPLANPANDARAIGQLLSGLGFDVDTVADADARKLDRSLDRLVEDAADADVALIYYSGHGIEAGGEDFLVPVDADAGALDAAAQRLVPLSRAIEALRRTVPVTIVLLDACRTSPFPPGAAVRLDAGAAPAPVAATGLAAPRGAVALTRQAAPEDDKLGVVIGFAAAPGEAALDGEPGGNSPYAAALLKHLPAGGYAFGDVMTMVSEEVYLATNGRQTPWTNAGLRRLLYFGRSAEPAEGDDAAIRGERRKLLLTIAETPLATRGMVEQVAAGSGVPLDALYGMLKVLEVDTSGGQGDLAAQLQAGAEKLAGFMAERDAQTRQDPDLIRLAGLAERAEREGAMALALDYRARASARADEIDAAVDEAEANVEARRRELADAYRGHAETAILNFDYATAAERYLAAAGQIARWDGEAALNYVLSAADARADQGWYRGENAALGQAVDLYRQALASPVATADRARTAAIQTNLGIAYTMLGERETGTQSLRMAIAAYGETLKVFTRKRSPEGWATTQINLGNAYRTLAARGGGEAELRAAQQAYEGAQQVFTRKRDPRVWAGLQSNIGNVQYDRAERSGDIKLYRASVQSLRDVTRIWTRETGVLDWARGAANLASSLTALGARTGDRAALEEAVGLYRAVLEVKPRDRMPAEWASAQNNLGSALMELSALEEGTGAYREALEALELALSARDRQADPVGWASASYNIGRVLLFLGRREASVPRFGEAVAALRAAAAALDPAQMPVQWARARSVEGEALVEIGERSGDAASLRAARQAFLDAAVTFRAQGMGESGQGFWEKQVARIDADLAKLK
ncbi:MAG: caspase family protein [Rhizobiales bacterium]|nr:caspase family protein [Hyphomicrobiales bacterium]